GGKGKSLAKLARSGLPVPTGFVLTTKTYRDFVAANDLQPGITSAVTEAAGTDATSFDAASVKIKLLFEASTISDEIATSIRRAYADLGEDLAVAVRSSATAEDLPNLSFAGQQDTYLNICGQDALLEAVRCCWASLWTARAIGYRQQMNIDQQAVAMAVIVQVMVQADVSGIVFTANPATGDRSEIIVNASFGLGELIVSGEVTPDTFVVDKTSLEIKKTDLGTKEEMTVSNGDQGTTIQPVPVAKRTGLSLDTDLLSNLASLSLKVEQLFDGVPQDIEWAVLDGQYHLLQSRPITNLPAAPLQDVRWDPPYKGGKLIRRQVVENMPDPLSTLFEELYLQVGLEHSIDKLMANYDAPFDIGQFIVRPMFVTVNGYAYGRADFRIQWRLIFKIVGWYRKALPAMLRDIIPQWRDDGLPTYLATIDQWKTVDINSATDEQLLSGVQALTVADADYWFSVALVIAMSKVTDGALHTFLSVLVKGELISGMFLRGFPSKTLEAQVELETISSRIQAVRTLQDLVIITPASDLIETLKHDADGFAVAENIQQYLEKYGHQIYNLDFVQETQIEDPLPVLLSLKALVENVGSTAQQAEMVLARESLAKRTSASIGPIRRWMFRKLLRWAQTYGPYREESLFYMGAAWPTLRKLTLELGRRLAESGTLPTPNDVFYLNSEEIVEAYTARLQGKAVNELGLKARQRWELREARKKLHPPPMVPEGRFKIGPFDLSFFETQKRNKDDSNTLNGFAVSPGKVTGTATVIMSPDDFEQMKPGTILVCPTTTPAWTPLFSQALALVTDIGGILAHGSIVAREYGIPAVMGTGNITQRIVTGRRIAVDGEAGTVTILD
ncbi:MAG: PEP-utilizing enzyme, partial [Gammaproteobacteria bacterium]|nr:PEP-utilizing enzyme [Gammaproteobacteria bacterium]